MSRFAAFPVGRWLDRGSARLLMTTGSVLATLGVVAWSQSRPVPAFYGSWLLIGIAMGLVLYEPAQVVLVKQFGARATRAIATLTLVAGFASTIFQPITAVLQHAWGWRRAHAAPQPVAASDNAAAVRTVVVRDPAMTGLTIAFTLSIGAMSTAVVHLISYLTDHGWTELHAAFAAALIGASQVAARVVFGIFAEHVDPARSALLVLLVPVGGIVVLASSNGAVVAWLAVVRLGIGQGTTTPLRPLVLSRRLSPPRLRPGGRHERGVEHRGRRRRSAAVGRRSRTRLVRLPDRVRRLRAGRRRRSRRLPQPALPPSMVAPALAATRVET